MYILGLNGGLRAGYQDTSSVLLKDGKIVQAIEEERLSRVKHAPGQLPSRSLLRVLKEEGISINDVDHIAFHGATWGEGFTKHLEDYLSHLLGTKPPPIERLHHHLCHGASAHYSSGWDETLVLTADSSGDGHSVQLMQGKGSELKLLRRWERPQSLGLFYSAITQWCGFERDHDEYKLMGLAAYGDKQAVDLSFFLSTEDPERVFSLNTNYLHPIEPGAPQRARQQTLFNDRLVEKLGQPRARNQPIDDHHKNVAAHAQHLLEKALINLVRWGHEQTSLKKLCLAGGVALNALANQKLMNLSFIDGIFVQPASSDAGISLGAAQWLSAQKGVPPEPMSTACLGPKYSHQDIFSELELTGVRFQEVSDPALMAAKRIASGQIVGWFQGGSEFGPRALGARSLLASPQIANMKETINNRIKFRQSFRPFCPSVLSGDIRDYFKGQSPSSPFMNIVYEVRDEKRSEIPAVTHVDGTARVQTVDAVAEPLYAELLEKLKKQSGHAVVLNTSFNLSHEPIVESPRQALASFFSSGLNSCFIGPFLIEKSQ